MPMRPTPTRPMLILDFMKMARDFPAAREDNSLRDDAGDAVLLHQLNRDRRERWNRFTVEQLHRVLDRRTTHPGRKLGDGRGHGAFLDRLARLGLRVKPDDYDLA